MTPDDEIAVLKADRENLHQRVRELLADNEKLRERLGPHGLEVVMIGDSGHYVNQAVRAEIESLRRQLDTEKEITANLTWAVEQLQAKPAQAH
jgi:uncharacterized protein YoxC